MADTPVAGSMARSDAQADAASRHRRVRAGAAVVVGVLGVALTGVFVLAVRSNYDSTEARLLRVQTGQADDVLSSAVVAIETRLDDVADVSELTNGSPQAFARNFAPVISSRQFSSLSLWSDDHGALRPIAQLGAPPALELSARPGAALLGAAVREGTYGVEQVTSASGDALAYVVASGNGRYVVDADSMLATNRHSTLKANSAFSQLNFAIYLGRTPSNATLLGAAGPTPHRGELTDEASTRFGSSWLTIVTAPAVSLAGSLPAEMPWFVGVAGVLLTLLAALAAQELVARQHRAELDAQRSRQLSEALAQLYTDQRSISETLQRSLLPVHNPPIPGLSVATRYVAGSADAEVGGDWYSIVSLDGANRFAFVVGDVAGRGIHAATVMAALRYTTRTLLLEGREPAYVLRRTSEHVRDPLQSKFATVLVGVGDARTRELTIANAGHLNPLLVGPSGCEYLTTRVGPPLGIAGARYEQVTVVVEPGTTFIGFTDGLVERRDESLDDGLKRLAEEAATGPRELDALLTELIAERSRDGVEDDIAVLAMRFR